MIELGEVLRDEMEAVRAKDGLFRWRCPEELRERVVAYARACRGDGESSHRIASRLQLPQPTLSRWLRRTPTGGGGFRSVAIVPAAETAAATPPATLRLLTPRGFIVEGVDLEALARLLRVCG